MQYEKLILGENGEVIKSEFVVEGRKQPLTEIREHFLKSHANYMRKTTDEEFSEMSKEKLILRLSQVNAEFHEAEDTNVLRLKLKALLRTRHMKIWHDLSTVANHSHIVFLDIQTIIGSPEVYIVGRPSSSDSEQLAYVDSRLECLEEISLPLQTREGQEIHDVMRFFHGDNPAQQFECGQQKGGTYYCSTCGVNANRVHELDYSFRCTHISFSDRQKLILEGTISKQQTLAGNNKPTKNLKKAELLKELNSRNIYDGESRADLSKLLTDELHGVQRVPALLYPSPLATLASIQCDKYEILPFEPLHDIGKHIENVLEELPMHVNSDQAKIIKETMELAFGNKETKRCFDYRCALIMVTNHIIGKVSVDVQKLLQSLVEIQSIAYANEESRSPRSVLRLHNLTWLHAFLCWRIISFHTKRMTSRKFYGAYFHKISAHAAIQNRLISGKSCHAEEQERVFNAITNITRATSSKKPGHIIGNIFLRLQAEKNMEAYHTDNTTTKQQAYISKLAHTVPALGNTVFPFSLIKGHSSSWQAHLERISDFLLAGKDVWWTSNKDGDVEFFDSKQSKIDCRAEGPKLHHFRSSNFKEEESFLTECWSICLEKEVSLPLYVLRVKDKSKDVFNLIQTEFLLSHKEGAVIGKKNSPFGNLNMDDVAECDIVDDQGTSEHDTDKCDIDNECDTEEKEDNVISFTLATSSADQEVVIIDQSLMHTKTTGIYLKHDCNNYMFI